MWTTGNVIRQAVRAIVARDDLELVGAYARSPAKSGVDVGELSGLGRHLGVTATNDVDELLGLGLDASCTRRCTSTRPSRPPAAGRGRTWSLGGAHDRHEPRRSTEQDALRSAALEGGATLFGSGMNPGYAQLLAAVAAGISSGVERVTVARVGRRAASSSATPTSRPWGGVDPATTPAMPTTSEAGTAVFAEAVEVLGRLLGVELDETACDVEFAHATEDVEVAEMVIRQRPRGRDGRELGRGARRA